MKSSRWTGLLVVAATSAAALGAAVARPADAVAPSVGVTGGWGSNQFGGVGDGTTTERHIPTQSGVADAIAIAAGPNHSLAVRPDGTAWAWGLNGNGQLG